MSTIRRVRNRECLPYVDTEAEFIGPIFGDQQPDHSIEHEPCTGSDKFDRLYKYHTLATIRKHCYYQPRPHLFPQDALDLSLSSTYDHRVDSFADTEDIHLQPETVGKFTWRRLKNTRDKTPEREDVNSTKQVGKKAKESLHSKGKRKVIKKKSVPYLYNYAQKLLVGGVLEKKIIESVGLMVTSYHSAQTKDGYSRQMDGNPYMC